VEPEPADAPDDFDGPGERRPRAKKAAAEDPDSPWKWSSDDRADPLIALVASRWATRKLPWAEEARILDARVGPPDLAAIAAREAEERRVRDEAVARAEELEAAKERALRAKREEDEKFRALSEHEKREERRNWEEYCARRKAERAMARQKEEELARERQARGELPSSDPVVSFADAARVLEKCQRLDPPGICARDLQECLLIQARARGLDDGLVGIVIRKHLKHIEAKNLSAIAREEKVTVEEVAEAAEELASMEARPARGFVDEDPRYITPDVYIQKVGDRYEVVMNDDGLSKLRIGRRYLEALRSGTAGEYIQERLRAAKWLIRSIHQRQRTIHKVTESIIKFQQDFLDQGIAHLKPLILKDVAEDIGMHESTVSRVTTNKYVHTPQGIFELKYFFNSGISRTGGDEVASEAVKNEIKNIVAAENGKSPYSDQKIVEILHGRGIEIARRTVAKYREVLGILPSSKRRSFH
jgi:RNA polymerase sigma-54 factor